MSRWTSGVVGAAAGWLAAWTTPWTTADPPVVRARRIELVDADGVVVGHLGATAHGAELVLGGTGASGSQASLVTDGAVAAVNLTGPDAVARLVGERGAWVDLRAVPEREDEDAVVARLEALVGPAPPPTGGGVAEPRAGVSGPAR